MIRREIGKCGNGCDGILTGVFFRVDLDTGYVFYKGVKCSGCDYISEDHPAINESVKTNRFGKLLPAWMVGEDQEEG